MSPYSNDWKLQSTQINEQLLCKLGKILKNLTVRKEEGGRWKNERRKYLNLY